MPHFHVEYSANIGSHIDMQAFVDMVHEAARKSGIFPLGGIRVRAYESRIYAIADRDERNGFIHVILRMGAGRSLEDKKKACSHIYQEMERFCAPLFQETRFGLSFESVEIDPELSFKTNNMHSAT